MEEANFSVGGDEFPDIPGANNLLDSIDFDDIFMGLHDGSGDDLLDLEMDPELLLVEFEGEGYSSEGNNGHLSFDECDGSNNGSSELVEPVSHNLYKEIEEFMSIDEEEEIESKKEQESQSTTTTTTVNSSIKKRYKGKSNKNYQDKRKSKKYRSHKEHLLVRETESANWSTQTRQIYAYGNIARGGGNVGYTLSPWHHRPAMMGYPPSTTMHPGHHFRPLHVWGHPTIPTNVDLRARMPMWPKHSVPSPSHPQPTWAPPQPQLPPDPSLWHSPHQHRFTTAAVPGIPPNAMYKLQNNTISSLSATKTSLDPNPWNERSIDATIGDVLAKPWLPLPIGLKPPSVDSVLVELQCQGITKIPP